MKLKIDVFDVLSDRTAAMNSERYQRRIQQSVSEVTRCEELGYDTYWWGEHHFQEVGWEIMPNPVLFLAYLAGVTSRIRLGTAVAILPQWNPVRLAEDICLVDHLSRGRVEFGVGRGYNRYELDGFEVMLPDAEGRALSAETLDVVIKALRNEKFSHAGKFFNVPAGKAPAPQITTIPRPYQRPTMPLWLAISSETSARIAARYRMKGLFAFASEEYLAKFIGIYRKTAEEAGWAVGPDDILVGIPTYVADSEAQARDHMEEFMTSFAYYFSEHGFNVTIARPGEPVIPAEKITYDYMNERATYFGTAESVTARSLDFLRRMKVGRYLFFLLNENHEHRMRTLELFADRVRPTLDAELSKS